MPRMKHIKVEPKKSKPKSLTLDKFGFTSSPDSHDSDSSKKPSETAAESKPGDNITSKKLSSTDSSTKSSTPDSPNGVASKTEKRDAKSKPTQNDAVCSDKKPLRSSSHSTLSDADSSAKPSSEIQSKPAQIVSLSKLKILRSSSHSSLSENELPMQKSQNAKLSQKYHSKVISDHNEPGSPQPRSLRSSSQSSMSESEVSTKPATASNLKSTNQIASQMSPAKLTRITTLPTTAEDLKHLNTEFDKQATSQPQKRKLEEIIDDEITFINPIHSKNVINSAAKKTKLELAEPQANEEKRETVIIPVGNRPAVPKSSLPKMDVVGDNSTLLPEGFGTSASSSAENAKRMRKPSQKLLLSLGADLDAQPQVVTKKPAILELKPSPGYEPVPKLRKLIPGTAIGSAAQRLNTAANSSANTPTSGAKKMIGCYSCLTETDKYTIVFQHAYCNPCIHLYKTCVSKSRLLTCTNPNCNKRSYDSCKGCRTLMVNASLPAGKQLKLPSNNVLFAAQQIALRDFKSRLNTASESHDQATVTPMIKSTHGQERMAPMTIQVSEANISNKLIALQSLLASPTQTANQSSPISMTQAQQIRSKLQSLISPEKVTVTPHGVVKSPVKIIQIQPQRFQVRANAPQPVIVLNSGQSIRLAGMPIIPKGPNIPTRPIEITNIRPTIPQRIAEPEDSGPRIKHVARSAIKLQGAIASEMPPTLRLSALPDDEKSKIYDEYHEGLDSSDDEKPHIVFHEEQADIDQAEDGALLGEDDEDWEKYHKRYVEKTPKNSRPKFVKQSKSTDMSPYFGKRKPRCGHCVGCKSENCTQCVFCKDMKKYGGPGRLKQCCLDRRCVNKEGPAYGNKNTPRFADSRSNSPILVQSKKRIGRLPQRHRRDTMSSVSRGDTASSTGDSEMLDIEVSSGDIMIDVKLTNKPLQELLDNADVRSSRDTTENAVDEMTLVAVEDPSLTEGQNAGFSLLEAQHKIMADFIDQFDIDKMWQQGMAILTTSTLNITLCYICGSRGRHQMIYCGVCCEPFHEFCLEMNDRPSKLSALDWLCKKCKYCCVCEKPENLVSCYKCEKLYHSGCVKSGYPVVTEGRWLCEKCAKCKSCGVTNYSTKEIVEWSSDYQYCLKCQELRDKGNYCPICEACYSDDDWECKMIGCSTCESWTHSKCAGLSDDLYALIGFVGDDEAQYVCEKCNKLNASLKQAEGSDSLTDQTEQPDWLKALINHRQRGFYIIIASLMNRSKHLSRINAKELESFYQRHGHELADLNNKSIKESPKRQTGSKSDQSESSLMSPPSVKKSDQSDSALMSPPAPILKSEQSDDAIKTSPIVKEPGKTQNESRKANSAEPKTNGKKKKTRGESTSETTSSDESPVGARATRSSARHHNTPKAEPVTPRSADTPSKNDKKSKGQDRKKPAPAEEVVEKRRTRHSVQEVQSDKKSLGNNKEEKKQEVETPRRSSRRLTSDSDQKSSDKEDVLDVTPHVEEKTTPVRSSRRLAPNQPNDKPPNKTSTPRAAKELKSPTSKHNSSSSIDKTAETSSANTSVDSTVSEPAPAPDYLDLTRRFKNIDWKLPPITYENLTVNSAPLDLQTVKQKVDDVEYATISDFLDDIVRIIQGGLTRARCQSHKVMVQNVAVKHLLEKEVKVLFPWYDINKSPLWIHNIGIPRNVHANSHMPPYDDHLYSMWVKRDDTPEPSILQNTSAALNNENLTNGTELARNSMSPETVEKQLDCLPSSVEGDYIDMRRCQLCNQLGDDHPNDSGRMIYAGADDWVHINCAIWSCEVFEEIDGSLQQVHSAVSRGKQLECSACGLKGATIGCCYKSCGANFHFMCARRSFCRFMEDKQVFCPNCLNYAQGKVVGHSRFSTLRTVTVDFTNQKIKKQWQQGFRPDDLKVVIGSMGLNRFGFVTPDSDFLNLIVPIEFSVTRTYWSTANPRQKCLYTCRVSILRSDGQTSTAPIPDTTICHDSRQDNFIPPEQLSTKYPDIFKPEIYGRLPDLSPMSDEEKTPTRSAHRNLKAIAQTLNKAAGRTPKRKLQYQKDSVQPSGSTDSEADDDMTEIMDIVASDMNDELEEREVIILKDLDENLASNMVEEIGKISEEEMTSRGGIQKVIEELMTKHSSKNKSSVNSTEEPLIPSSEPKPVLSNSKSTECVEELMEIDEPKTYTERKDLTETIDTITEQEVIRSPEQTSDESQHVEKHMAEVQPTSQETQAAPETMDRTESESQKTTSSGKVLDQSKPALPKSPPTKEQPDQLESSNHETSPTNDTVDQSDTDRRGYTKEQKLRMISQLSNLKLDLKSNQATLQRYSSCPETSSQVSSITNSLFTPPKIVITDFSSGLPEVKHVDPITGEPIDPQDKLETGSVVSHGTRDKLLTLVRKRSESLSDISQLDKSRQTQSFDEELLSNNRRSASMSDLPQQLKDLNDHELDGVSEPGTSPALDDDDEWSRMDDDSSSDVSEDVVFSDDKSESQSSHTDSKPNTPVLQQKNSNQSNNQTTASKTLTIQSQPYKSTSTNNHSEHSKSNKEDVSQSEAAKSASQSEAAKSASQSEAAKSASQSEPKKLACSKSEAIIHTTNQTEASSAVPIQLEASTAEPSQSDSAVASTTQSQLSLEKVSKLKESLASALLKAHEGRADRKQPPGLLKSRSFIDLNARNKNKENQSSESSHPEKKSFEPMVVADSDGECFPPSPLSPLGQAAKPLKINHKLTFDNQFLAAEDDEQYIITRDRTPAVSSEDEWSDAGSEACSVTGRPIERIVCPPNVTCLITDIEVASSLPTILNAKVCVKKLQLSDDEEMPSEEERDNFMLPHHNYISASLPSVNVDTSNSVLKKGAAPAGIKEVPREIRKDMINYCEESGTSSSTDEDDLCTPKVALRQRKKINYNESKLAAGDESDTTDSRTDSRTKTFKTKVLVSKDGTVRRQPENIPSALQRTISDAIKKAKQRMSHSQKPSFTSVNQAYAGAARGGSYSMDPRNGSQRTDLLGRYRNPPYDIPPPPRFKRAQPARAEDQVPNYDSELVGDGCQLSVLASENLSSQLSLNKEPDVQPTRKPSAVLQFEITSEHGFKCQASNWNDAWRQLIEELCSRRTVLGCPYISYSALDGLAMYGFDHPSISYLTEQLYGSRFCHNYRFRYHKPPLLEYEEELRESMSGCIRSDGLTERKKPEMFSFIDSMYRRKPTPENGESKTDYQYISSRRPTSTDLPAAMKYRHLKSTAKEAVGVYGSGIHGRGLFCKRGIESGEMIIEYAGETIRHSLCDKREKYYENRGIGCYMFKVDKHLVVDATMKGNAARFINHSCDPNCFSKVIDVNGAKHIVILALRDIERGEELTYDYKFPLEEDKIPCTCAAKKCRGSMN